MRGEKRRRKKKIIGYARFSVAPMKVTRGMTLEPQPEPSLPHFCPLQFQELLFSCCAIQRHTVKE